jgi:fructokinase
MLRPPTLAAARAAWRVSGPRKVFDPNARPRLLTPAPGVGGPGPSAPAPFEPDPAAVAAYRDVVEEFAAGADLVKLSSADAAVLWHADEHTVAERLSGLGGATIVITRGAAGALLRDAGSVTGSVTEITAPRVAAVDTTGAGDSVMAALVAGLLLTGRAGRPDWPALVRYALAVGALTVQGRGGATALPTAAAVRERFPQDVPSSSA